MKLIIRQAILALSFVLIMCPVFAQSKSSGDGSYKTGIGLRGGWHPGLTVKHFISDDAAIEGIFHTRYKYRGWVLTGLYEKHAQAFDVSRLRWFYGIGAHVGHFREGWYKDRWGDKYDHDIITVGIDGILGLEYHIGDIPFTIGADIKPFFDIINPGFGYWDAAISVRYAF